MSSNNVNHKCCGSLRFYRENKTTEKLLHLEKNKTYTIGSSGLASIRLPSKSPSLKPLHLKIQVDRNGHSFLAVIKSNNVLLNDKKLTNRTLLHPKDVINIFGNIIVYENDDLTNFEETKLHAKNKMNIKKKENIPLSRRTICISSNIRDSGSKKLNKTIEDPQKEEESLSTRSELKTPVSTRASSKKSQTEKHLREGKSLFKTPQSCKIIKMKSVSSSRNSQGKSGIRELNKTTPINYITKRKLSLNFDSESCISKRTRFSLQMHSQNIKSVESSFNDEASFKMDSTYLTSSNNVEVDDLSQFKESIPETPAKLFSEKEEEISHKSLKSSVNSSKIRRSTRISQQIQAKSSDLNSSAQLVRQNSVESESLNISGISKLQQTPNMKMSVDNSPNIRNSECKQIKSAKNDLSNVHGVKKLMKTPKVMKSPKNDLRNITNLRNLIFPRKTRSTNNDLTDVKGVKQLFLGKEKSPKNDLRNIVGVKKLMSTPKERQSPKNDLTRVPNLRNLIFPRKTGSPNNDITDVKGVKQLFLGREKSPKNDLRNILGVKKLMSTPKDRQSPKNDLSLVPNLRKLIHPKVDSSPKNDLTNVPNLKWLMSPKKVSTPLNDLTRIEGVKQLFTDKSRNKKTPKNDLTNIPNLRSLMSPKKVSTPRNDLRHIEGVKKLFADKPKNIKTPENDLTKVPNLKWLMSPRKVSTPVNDLTDVHGVKQLMSTPKIRKTSENDSTNVPNLKQFMATKNVSTPINDLMNLEGVDELFDEYENYSSGTEPIILQNKKDLSNSEFDMLLDKKPLRQYRGKSVSPTKNPSPPLMKRKTLGDKINCSPHVAIWVEEQIKQVKSGPAPNENKPTLRVSRAKGGKKENVKSKTSTNIICQLNDEIDSNKTVRNIINDSNKSTRRSKIGKESKKRKLQDMNVSSSEQEVKISESKRAKLSDKNSSATIRVTRGTKEIIETETLPADFGEKKLESSQNEININTSESNLDINMKNTNRKRTRSTKISVEDTEQELSTTEVNPKRTRSKRNIPKKDTPVESEVRLTRGKKKISATDNVLKKDLVASLPQQSNLETDAEINISKKTRKGKTLSANEKLVTPTEFEARQTRGRKKISVEVNKDKIDTLQEASVIRKSNLNIPNEVKAHSLLEESTLETDTETNIQKRSRGVKTIPAKENLNTPTEFEARKTRARKLISVEVNLNTSKNKNDTLQQASEISKDNLNNPNKVKTDALPEESNLETDAETNIPKRTRGVKTIQAKENLNTPTEFEARKTRGRKIIAVEVNMNTAKDILSQVSEIGKDIDTPRKTRNKKHISFKESLNTPNEYKDVTDTPKKTRGRMKILGEKSINILTEKENSFSKELNLESEEPKKVTRKGKKNISVQENIDTPKQTNVITDSSDTSKKTKGRKRTTPEENTETSNEKQQGNLRKLRKMETANTNNTISPEMILRRSKRNK